MASTTIQLGIQDAPLDPRALERAFQLARQALCDGQLIALPTETVYGIAARADHEDALERLAELKGRPEDMALTWHVPGPQSLEDAGLANAMTRRLAQRYWPGPLTLVLPGVPPGLERVAKDGWVGVRAPSHPGTSQLLRALDFPVVATSANVHGEPPQVQPDDVAATFGDRLALVLDGGPSALGQSSCVLQLGRGRFELLREGVIERQDLLRTAGRRIAFVCTGNTCRSPMAEGLARTRIAASLGLQADGDPSAFGFEIGSMGVFAGAGSPPSPHAVQAARELGADIEDHASCTATAERISDCDHVYCLTLAHLDSLRMKLPPGRDAHLDLLDPEGRDVPDPIGGSLEDYRRCARHILGAIEARLADWV